MTWLFSTLSKRMTILLVIGIIVIQITTFWFIESTLYQNNMKDNAALPQKLATFYTIVNNTQPALQAKTAIDISSDNFELLVEDNAMPVIETTIDFYNLKLSIVKILGDTKSLRLALGAFQAEKDSLGFSVKLDTGKWLNIHIHAHHRHQFLLKNVISYLVTMTILFILGMIILLRWLVKPLESMAQSVSLFNNPQQMINFQRYDTKEIMLLGTAINRMQARMAKLIEQRTYALAAISHDLKTPLTRMRMRLEYITTKKLQHSLLQDLTEMEQMVDSTLYYIKSGKNSEQKQIIDIASILETINNEMADSGLKAAFKKQYEGKLRVFGQHYSLKRALNNIIYNAVKYGEEASITLSRHENSIIICVEDKGKGIDPAQFANVFEPFVRLEQSRNSKTGGFGLGLTIAKTIIENHQGTITLSLNEACSLKVLITLPLHVK